MAYPFHRFHEFSTDCAPTVAPIPRFLKRCRYRQVPGQRGGGGGSITRLIEPLEPRLLLSADFLPAAADVAADGISLLSDQFEEFLNGEALLDQRIPFLLGLNDDVPEEEYFEAPTISDLFRIAVDANEDGFIDRGFLLDDDDEANLEAWDNAGNSDGFVTAGEILDALFFDPMEAVLRGITAGDATDLDFSNLLDGDLIPLFDGLDATFDKLKGGDVDYTIEFDVDNAANVDLTEDPNAGVNFATAFELTINRDKVPIDLGLEADDQRLLAFTGSGLNPEPVQVEVDATLSFGFEFGVLTGGQDPVDLGLEDFLVRTSDPLLVSVTANDGDMDFNLNIGFLGAKVVNGTLDLQVDVEALLEDPNTPAVLGFDESQYGFENTGGQVVANNAIPAANLPHEAGFFLRIGNVGISSEVLVADSNAVDNNALVADIEAALVTAGLVDLVNHPDLVSVDLTGSDEIRFSLPSVDVAPLGFDNEMVDAAGTLVATAGPGAFEPGSNVSFLLSLGGALPRLVSLRFADAAREDIGFGADEDASLGALVAQNAADVVGHLDEGGDTTANFTIKVSFAGGGSISAALAVDESLELLGPNPNANLDDLVADINAAITGSALAGHVAAGHNGSVISLSPAAGVSAVEITAADTTTANDIGFVSGQGSFLTLTAAGSIGDVSFDDALANTNDDAHFVVTINGTEHDIMVAADGGRASNAELVNAINAALGGLDVTASEAGGKVVLTADNSTVRTLNVVAENQDIDDLQADLERALTAAGVAGVNVSNDGVMLTLTAGGDSLEITRTLTLDAGVTGEELDPNDAVPDGGFAGSNGGNSNIEFNFPVEVLPGLMDADTGMDYDPQDLAFLGNFDPFGPLAQLEVYFPFGESELPTGQRFRLDFAVDPPLGDDPLIAIPNPIPAETLKLVNFAEVLQFNEIGPESTIGMLRELGAALDSIFQSGEFSLYQIPFTDAALTDMVAFQEMIENSLIYDYGPDGIFNPDPGPEDDNDRLLERVFVPDENKYGAFVRYTTAQELGDHLSQVLDMPLTPVAGLEAGGAINPTYNTGTNELTYDIDIVSSNRVSVGIDEAYVDTFAFNVDLSPFREFSINPPGAGGVLPEDLLVTFQARTALSTTFGFDLTPALTVAADNVEQRFFVRDAEINGAFMAELPANGVAGTALLGIVGVDVLMEGGLGAQFSARLHADGDAFNSQVTLQEIQTDIQDNYRGLQNDGIQVITDPVVSKLQSLNYDGQTNPPSNVAGGSRILSDADGTAYIFAVDDNGQSGTLTLFGVQGDFLDDELFVDVRDINGGGFRGGVANGVVVDQSYFGELNMAVSVQEGFKDGPDPADGFGATIAALDGVMGDITLNLVDFGDPNASQAPAVDLTEVSNDITANLGALADFTVFGYGDLISALEALGDLVIDLEAAYPVLTSLLPVVNRSVADLLGLRDNIERSVASARETLEEQQALVEDVPDVPTLTLQGMASALRGAFGLPDNSPGLLIELVEDGGTPYLTFDFDIEKTISTTLGLDIELGGSLPNLTSGKILRADGSLAWGFKIGINLDDPTDVQLFNPEGGLDGDLTIKGEGAQGVGAVFLAQVGDVPVQVMDGLVDIELEFDLGGLSFIDGKKTLGDVVSGDFTPNIDTQSYDISIPLFDPEGGLTGFLGEISSSGANLLDDVLSSSFDFLDTNALADLEALVASIDIPEFDALDNLLLLTDTADLFFEILQEAIDTATSIDIPIIGKDLADGTRFVEEFRQDFTNSFRQMVENTVNINTGHVETFLTNFFTNKVGFDFVDVDLLDLPGFNDEIAWTLSLGNTYEVGFDLGFDLGVPLLAMEVDAPLTVSLDWSLDIGLGANEELGAFIILEQGGGKELDINLTVDLPAPNAQNNLFRGQLGFLELNVKNQGSGLNFDFDIDLANNGTGDPNLIGINDLGSIGFDVEIGGGALPGNDHILDLALEVGFSGGDAIIPKLSTDFIMDWSLAPQGLVDNAIDAGLDLIDFRGVEVDLADFLGGFLGDVLGEIVSFTEPLNEIVAFLSAPIPILSFFDPNISLLSLAEDLGVAETEYIEWIIDAIAVFDALNVLNLTGDDKVMLPIGDLEIYDPGDSDGDLLSGAAGLAANLFDIDADIVNVIEEAIGGFANLLGEAGDAFDTLAGAIGGGVSQEGDNAAAAFNTFGDITTGEFGDLFSFPFLDNPSSLLGLLVGQNVTFVQVDIPPLGVGFDYEQFFTIFGPLGVSIGAGFYVGFDLSFGFDSYGLNRLADSNFTNPGLVFDGFFFGDREAGSDNDVTTGTDIDEIFLEFTLTGTAELNLGIARGGVGGGITARIGWDWYDPDNDGAMHISEIINSIEHEFRNGDPAKALLAPFDLGGSILAELFAFLIIDLGIVELEYFFPIFGPEPVLTFDIPFERTPILATDLDNGTLQLNMGPNAIDRLNGDKSDGNENFRVEKKANGIEVSSSTLGVTSGQLYEGNYDHVVALGGLGNDTIEFVGFDESTITFDLQGGVGDDTIIFDEDEAVVGNNLAVGAGAIIRGGRGNDRLIGGHLNDTIFGGQGDDHIEGGRGYDILFGDEGSQRKIDNDTNSIGTRVSGLDGNDTIYGGSSEMALADQDLDDIIFGGGGLDILHGDGGSDVILGDGGRFNYNLVSGHLDFASFIIPTFVPNDPLDDMPTVSTDAKIQAILLAVSGSFSGTELGAGADDTIHGGAGGDIIIGGAANDTVHAGGGMDYVIGGKGFDTIHGDDGNDRLFGNDQDDIINGGLGDDVIAGGLGDDTLHGNEDQDYMTGSRGRDIMFGDAGNDELHGQGEPDIMFGGIGNDLVVGGVGSDIMFGDDGLVVKFRTADLIIGIGSAALAVPFKVGADSNDGSLDLILTDAVVGDGNDILSGGSGGDVILGGGGDDLAGGDVDPRSSIANTGAITTPIGDDLIIGDGGVVEFNDRYLQRVASIVDNDPTSFRDTLYGDNGNDVIIGGQGRDGDDNGLDLGVNVLGNAFLLAGGHGPGRGATDEEARDNDIILGDNGELIYIGSADPDNRGRLSYVQTTDVANSTGGADTAYGELGDDIIFGGVNSSTDVLVGSLGEDVILGDNGLVHFNYDWAADANRNDAIYTPADGDPDSIDLIRSFNDGWGGTDIVSGDAGVDTLLGGEAGDQIFGDNATASAAGDDAGDVMLGDNGDIFLKGDIGQLLVQGTAIDYITTTDVAESSGGPDTLSGNAGADVILGGVNDGGNDIIYGDAASHGNHDADDLILGDNGILLFNYDWMADGDLTDSDYSPTDGDRLTLDLVRSFIDNLGGTDIISGDVGGDLLLGGNDGDFIHGDDDVAEAGALDGNDISLGDNGDVYFTGHIGALVLLNSAVNWITTRDLAENTGGADVIEGNAGNDIIIGGVNDGGVDTLHGDAEALDANDAADIILGDQGRLFYAIGNAEQLVQGDTEILATGDDDPTTLDKLETYNTGSQGGIDHIYGNDGADIAMGGTGDDLIYGDFYLANGLTAAGAPGDDVLLGDGGEFTFQNGKGIVLRSIETNQGGVDTIHGNDGGDTILGGMFGDLLFGETDAAHLALIETGAGEDSILGDNGRLDWILPQDDILGRQDVIDELQGVTVLLDVNPDNLDRITTIAPTHGGDDVIYGNGNSSAQVGDLVMGGTGNDTIYGDTDELAPNGVDGPDGADLLFGDHGKIYPTLPTVDGFFINNNFFSIDILEANGANFDVTAGNDFADVIWGNAASDILIGGQDDDILLGGTQDDDLIGGHNVAGGDDDLDPMPGADQKAISPLILADLDPSDVNEINDIMDGGADDDVMAGDNAIIIRQLDAKSPRFRMTNNGLLYVLDHELVGTLADIDVGFSANITGEQQDHQDMTLVRTVILLDHSEATEDDAVANAADPRPFGNDIMVGGSEDDEIFGQLGDDTIQGDGEIDYSLFKLPAAFDLYNPAQNADPDFDIRNFSSRTDLVTATDHTLRFSVFEALNDGDDYIEGNGGNDRMYGNLGQDDMIGGSSILFGLGDDFADFHGAPSGNALRPDGADLIYGGAGNTALLSRNASFGGPDNDISGATLVPETERHATDADTILGDNGEIYRIVVDIAAEGNPENIVNARFNYDRNETTASGFVDSGYGDDQLTIRVRAVDLGDYGYSYGGNNGTREVLGFLATARGEGDLIYGESGDDVIHGMTGDDAIFGNSEADDLHGEIGSDYLLGGTGIDGIVGDDGLIFSGRNDLVGEDLYGIDGLLPEQTNLKKNESPDPRSLNAEVRSPGNIQRAIINVENELIKRVELLAFRTDDLDTATVGEFFAEMRFNDIIFGGLDNDFIHAGDGDDAVSGAEALETYYSGIEPINGTRDFQVVSEFLQTMQSIAPDNPADLTDNPFWFEFAPYNPGDVLVFEGKTVVDGNGQRPSTRDEFFLYDEFNPRRKIMLDNTGNAVANEVDGVWEFILNFDHEEGALDTRFSDGDKASDGDDRIFGDLDNDWLVGGSGRDHMYGGRGNDLLNMDDDHTSASGGKQHPKDPPPDPLDNSSPDAFQAYADIVYSGAGRDVMILNTGADRAIDWVGEFNSYIVPFSPFGAFHISRTLQPQVPEFLYALSASDGIDANVDLALLNNTVDAQLFVDQKNLDVRTDDPDPLRAYEPFGELGMVRQTDFDWQEQTGAPNDPQPGNLQGKREIMRRELFNDGAAAVPLAADVGILTMANGVLEATPEAVGEEVVGLYPMNVLQPLYTEILVTVNADKDKAGVKSNGYVIFDYQGPENFKFAGIEAGIDKLQIGHRDASGWVVDVQTQVQLKANTDYDLTVVLFGSQATVYVNENKNVSYDFNDALNDGGMLGLGTDNSVTRFDDLQIQTLPPVWTFSNETDFDSAADNPFTSESGTWTVAGGNLLGQGSESNPAVATDAIQVVDFSRLELLADISTDGQGGFVFDYYSNNEFKYVLLDVANDEVVLGHYIDGQWRVDASVAYDLDDGASYSVMLTVFGSTASVTVDGAAVVTHTFNSLLNDGGFGVLSAADSSFDNFLVRGDDPAYGGESEALMAAAAGSGGSSGDALNPLEVEALSNAAIDQLARMFALDDAQQAMLARLQIGVADLAGNQLASFQEGSVLLDYNAAGNGWFVDNTPRNAREFGHHGEAGGSIDLFSALLHEYGHALGLDHDAGISFMAEQLNIGQRYELPRTGTVKVFHEDSGQLVDPAQGEVFDYRDADPVQDDDDVLILDAGTAGREFVLEESTGGLIRWADYSALRSRIF